MYTHKFYPCINGILLWETPFNYGISIRDKGIQQRCDRGQVVQRPVDLRLTVESTGRAAPVKLKGLMTGCHSFLFIFHIFLTCTFIQSHSYNIFICRYCRGPYISSSLVSSVGKIGKTSLGVPNLELNSGRYATGQGLQLQQGEGQCVQRPVDLTLFRATYRGHGLAA